MNSVNYRYQDFQNQSFRDEFRVGSGNYADFRKVVIFEEQVWLVLIFRKQRSGATRKHFNR